MNAIIKFLNIDKLSDQTLSVYGKRVAIWIPFVLIGMISIGLLITFSEWAYDDPFITYRYARNLLNGFGFVYNPGERILSTTTPLFTLMLALIGLVVPDLHLVAIIIGILSLAVGGLFIFDLGRTWNSPIVGWTGLLLYPTFPLLVGTLGSETPVYLALCLGAYVFYARDKLIFSGILIGLATLARPDGILVLGILGLDYLYRIRRPIPWKPLSVILIILISWASFAWLYFGSPLPATLAAKQQQGLMAISQGFARGLLTVVQGYDTWFYIEVLAALVGIIYAILKRRQWGIILIWPLIYFASYSILGVTRYFWYYAPLVPGFVIAVGLGLTALAAWINSLNQKFLEKIRLDIFIPCCILLTLVITNGINLFQMSRHNDPRYSVYRVAGEWLNDNTMSSEEVGALEVGIIGYFANRTMIDFAGLIQPKVADQFNRDTTYEDSALWAVANYNIDYLVLQDGLFSRLEGGYVIQNCELVQRFQGEHYSYGWDLSILECR